MEKHNVAGKSSPVMDSLNTTILRPMEKILAEDKQPTIPQSDTDISQLNEIRNISIGGFRFKPGSKKNVSRYTGRKEPTDILKCYGFLYDDGGFDCTKFAHRSHAYILGSRFIENGKGHFVDARLEADWLSVSTFKNSNHGRTEENISHVLCAFLDLDGPYTRELPDGEKVTLPLTEDLIRQRCYLLDLPPPMMIESSPGRFHVKFYFRKPVSILKKGYVKLVQRALFEAFKDMGADPVVTEDLTRFLRNENQRNSVNKKYPDKRL